MNAFLKAMAEGPRKIAITGHFGSGKTEVSVSLAMALAKENIPNLALCDLDLENPYFRSRERQSLMEEAGIKVYSDPFKGRNGSELQTIDAAIRTPLEDATCRVILDCGGDATGAMILNQFHPYMKEDAQLISVVNCNRPGTDTPQKAADQINNTMDTTGIKVTGIISNAHLIRYTTTETVVEGMEFTREVSRLTGIPVLCACCMESLAEELSGCDFNIFPIGMYMRDSYLDKQV
ncbi:MAG: ATP-binding protein [Lachnospiraceae bacterium]|nr:ATP-binding protein [Lachnospiraceae bacterium]